MNRASDRDMRIAAVEGKTSDLMERLEVVSVRQDTLIEEVARLKKAHDLMADAIFKQSRELGAQRGKYPLG